MILHDDKWVMVAENPEPAPPKKKRLVTEAMKAAARTNARLSTGPKSLEGKRRSALNGTKSAHTCNQLIFLEEESTEEFDVEVTLTARRLGARTEPEIEQVRMAVYQEWKARRIERAEVSAVNQTVNAIVDSFYEAMDSEVRTLSAALDQAPGESVAGLMQSSAGCSHLIGQFEILREWTAKHSSFEDCMRVHALNLGGHDPKHLFRDPVVMELNRAYLGELGGKGGFDAAGAADAFVFDRAEEMSLDEYERRLERLVIDLPDRHEGREILQNYLEDHIQSLTRLRGLLELREERDQAEAIGAAQATVTVEGDRRVRYTATATRLSHAHYRMLFTMQAERRKFGEGDLDGLDQETGPAAAAVLPAEAPETGAAAAGEGEWKSEAQATQVAGGIGGNNAPSAVAAAISEVPAGAGHDPLSAAIEAGGQELAQRREFDPLE
jgi:hypothetical protein